MNRISELEEKMAHLLEEIKQEKTQAKIKVDKLSDEAKNLRNVIIGQKIKMIIELIKVGHCYKYKGLGLSSKSKTITYMKVLENNGKSMIVNQISKKYDENDVLVLYMFTSDFKLHISTLANYSVDYKREIGLTEISEDEFNKEILK